MRMEGTRMSDNADVLKLTQKLMTEVGDNKIEHFGIKGMKWGVRRGRDVAKTHGTSTSTKSAKDMSDDELRTRINRINMERNYEKLTAPKSAGKDYVKSLLKQAGNEVAKDFVTSAMRTVAKGPKEKAIKRLEKALSK